MTVSFSRRGVLAGLASLAAPAVHAASTDSADVIIVGAGVAGLSAARAMRAVGKRAIVVEARDRIGGRVLTEHGQGARYEAGALYIHWAERNPLAALARSAGLATESDAASRTPIRSFDEEAETTGAARSRRSADFGRLGALLDDEAVRDVSVATVAREAVPALDDAAAGLSRMSMGDEADRISARDYARLWSGDDLLLPGGYDQLIAALAEGVDVRLSMPITRIDWSGEGVAVEGPAGTLRAPRAIVTVPVGVLQAAAIRFQPDLPVVTRDALGGLGMGALSKIGMIFDFTKLDVPRGDIFARRPGHLFDFDCKPFNQDVVVAIFGGDFARSITRTPEEAVATALDDFVRVVGGEARAAFRSGLVHAWHNDPWSRGCYAHCLPGRADVRAALGAPIGDRLILAGEATAPTGTAMTTGGAFLSGEAAARWAFSRA